MLKTLRGLPALVFLLAATTAAQNLDIHLPTGTFRGTTAAPGVEKWLGLPFAQPPIGPLRFKAPVAITVRSSALKDASQFGNACPQPPAGNLGAPISEDCLYLNIWRPAGAGNAKLPVLIWLHGGAYTIGSGSQFDASELVLRSVAIQKPIIVVAINYRINTFGFLASAHQPPQDLNAGLLDQRMAFTFVQDNIRAFGGDPGKVTIWGQSAGGGSIMAHFIYPTERRLFRAGIAESATGPFKTSPPASTYDRPGLPFNRLITQTGCATSSRPVDCLRAVPFEALLNISNVMVSSTLNHQLWQPSLGPAGSMMTEVASSKIIRGDFLHLPWLGGTNVNEGNFFSTSLLNLRLAGGAQTSALDNFIRGLVIDNTTLTQDVLGQFETFFPENDTTLGVPFNTGDSLFDRGSAFYTDQMFLAPRRLFFQHGSSLQPMFGYYFREFIPGNDPNLGVAHAAELALIFGPIPTVASIEQTFANQLRDVFINFVTDLNPGGGWPRYSNQNKRVMQLIRDNITVIPDDWDVEKTDFSNTARVLREFQK